MNRISAGAYISLPTSQYGRNERRRLEFSRSDPTRSFAEKSHMYEQYSSDGLCSRRRVLAAASLAGATALAGCTSDDTSAAESSEDDSSSGDGSAPDSSDDSDADAGAGDDTDTSSGSDADSADGGDADGCDLGGSPTTFDPGEQSFPFHFEHPDTWERYNESTSDYESGQLAQLGHVEWRLSSGSYPVNMAISQHSAPTTDEEAAANWVSSFEMSEELDWGFTYEGTEITVYESDVSDDRSRQWKFLLPAHEADGVYGIMVQHQDVRNEYSCLDAISEIAKDTIESLRANPEYSP